LSINDRLKAFGDRLKALHVWLTPVDVGRTPIALICSDEGASEFLAQGESGRGLPQSKTLAREMTAYQLAKLLD